MDLKKIAEILEIDFQGENFEVSGINTLKEAKESEISFVANRKYLKDVEYSKAGAIIVDAKSKDIVPSESVAIVVESPYWAMATISKYFSLSIEDEKLPKAVVAEGSTISDKAELANGAVIGKNCTIMAGVYVGSNSVIGDNTILYPNVSIYRDSKIGSECIIHSGTVIGSDGFGFATNKMGEHRKIYHNGNVVIENDVEIGSNCTIDRAVFSSTFIKKGARIDNLVHIAHNCEIGEYTVIAGQSGFAGSSKTGRNTVFGAQSGVAGHLEIAPFTTIAARGGVTKTIRESGGTYAGFPLMQHKLWLKLQAKLAKLIK